MYRSTLNESWFKRIPDLTNIRVFGFGCYVYIPNEIRRTKGPGHKLLPKATKMVFVGYAEHQKGWKCFNPETTTVVVSTNVHFDNESLPVNGTKTAIPSLLETVFPHYSFTTPGDNTPEESAIANEQLENPDNQSKTSDHTSQQHNASNQRSQADAESIIDISDDESVGENLPLQALVVADDSPNFYEAMRGPDRENWTQAIAKEYKSLAENNVFSTPMILPTGHKASQSTNVHCY